MAIQDSNFNREFQQMMNEKPGARSTSNGGDSKADRPKAKFWLNIGISRQVVDKDGNTVEHFVALPQGIPLDTMEQLAIRGQSEDFRARLSAQNNLLEQVLAAAAKLNPGETKILTNGTGLAVQVRHVADEAAPIPVENNQYAVDLGF